MSADRITRVNELLHRALGGIFEMLVCPEARTLVTVTGVQTATNLRDATVFVSVYGDDATCDRVLKLINKRRVMIQSELAHKVIIKYTNSKTSSCCYSLSSTVLNLCSTTSPWFTIDHNVFI